MKSEFIKNNSSRFNLKHKYEICNLTLYSFYSHSNMDTVVSNAIITSILLLLGCIIVILLFAWTYSLRLIYPFDTILNKMFGTLEHSSSAPSLTTPSNEVEEILYVYDEMITHIKELTAQQIESVRKEDQIKLEKTYAILNSLQQQINPHFLYNTLNMINLGLISNEDKTVLIDVINKLANIFRYSISSARDTVCLCDEIDNLNDYIDIWCKRFREKYEIIWCISPASEMAISLKMILQPIVENCFFHAFNDRTDNCKIKIESYLDGNTIIVSISDNGCGMSENELSNLYTNITQENAIIKKKHIGLANIYKRMKLFYGDEMSLDINSIPGQGTTVTLKYPYTKL